MDSITVVYKAGSIGAMRCAKVVDAIVSDVKGLENEALEGFDHARYTTYRDNDGWLMVTIHAKENGRQYYTVMKRDEKRHRVTSLAILFCDDGRHVATAYTWKV